jgi:F-type H+-transporting ATPase subunit alpha
MIDSDKIIKQLEERLVGFDEDVRVQNIGKVYKNTDDVIVASGLSKACIGEIVYFEDGSSGVVLNLDEDYVSIILLGRGAAINEGDSIKTSGKILSIEVSEDLISRVINAIGQPLDDKPKIKKGKDMPLERIAPGVVERESVRTPLKTGIKAIDTMIPIGRGQRELIIGDRQTGKTSIALDTIINQGTNKEKPVICIYVAIGQKQNTVAQVVDKLSSQNALDYSIVVNASASDSVALQYLAPYTGVAIAEYFLEKGKDVLIIYDDLSKHAWAYRQISLVLKRPAGREAYPGDIFYLHSRLLERAVKLNYKNGGGSITALPIIETQANDISAYIPTNVISITDGQIYLQSDLFNQGIRPAINVGNSVSRVGGAAQTSLMKSVSGKLRLELAQYRELAVFSQFGGELDTATQLQIERGKRITEILKQSPFQPLSEPLQFLSINAVTTGMLDDIADEKIQAFEKNYHEFMERNHQKIVNALSTGQKPTDDLLKQIKKATLDFKKIFPN